MATPNKVDSNAVGLSFAEEASLKTLAGSPIFYELEPNSFSDFGADYKAVSRSPINSSRQRQKGTLTDMDAAGGFQTDLTQNNLLRMLQSFFFAAAHEKPCTIPMNAAQVVITGVTGTSETFAAAAGLDVFKAGHLAMFSGFSSAGTNNGLDVVVSANATTLVGTSAKTDETPTAAGKIQAVGFQFPSGDLSIAVSGGNARITSATQAMNGLGLNVGEWIYIGGDTAGTKFATCPNGYARISAIAAGYIDCDRATAALVTDTGSSKTVRVFFGTVIRNEKDPTLITRRSLQFERLLGSDDTTDATKIQSEYLLGAIANDLKLSIPLAGKVTADLSFVGMDVERRSGTTGKKTATRISVMPEDCFNTTSDLYRARLAVLDATTLNPTGLYAYVSQADISLKNNAQGNKALSVLGAFDVSIGNFEVDGSLTAYFSTVAANSAISSNSDVEFNVIMAQRNAGQVWDLPLMSLSGGKLQVTANKPIEIPLKSEAGECVAGYTLLHTNFPYLPDAAMPV